MKKRAFLSILSIKKMVKWWPDRVRQNVTFIILKLSKKTTFWFICHTSPYLSEYGLNSLQIYSKRLWVRNFDLNWKQSVLAFQIIPRTLVGSNLDNRLYFMAKLLFRSWSNSCDPISTNTCLDTMHCASRYKGLG